VNEDWAEKSMERWNRGIVEEWGKIWGKMEEWNTGRMAKELQDLNPKFQHSNIPLIPTEQGGVSRPRGRELHSVEDWSAGLLLFGFNFLYFLPIRT